MRDAQLPASRSRRRRTAGLVAVATAVAGLATAFVVAAPPSRSAPGPVAEAGKAGTAAHSGTPAGAGVAATPWMRRAGAPLTVIAHRGPPRPPPRTP